MEHIFLLVYYLGFTVEDVRRLPIPYRVWYIERLQREINKNAEQGVPSRAAHDNSPTERMLRGQRPDAPARTRRVTW